MLKVEGTIGRNKVTKKWYIEMRSEDDRWSYYSWGFWTRKSAICAGNDVAKLLGYKVEKWEREK